MGAHLQCVSLRVPIYLEHYEDYVEMKKKNPKRIAAGSPLRFSLFLMRFFKFFCSADTQEGASWDAALVPIIFSRGLQETNKRSPSTTEDKQSLTRTSG